MPTSVHLSPALLTALDAQAKRLKISRNKLIAQTLEQAVAQQTRWPQGFLEAYRAPAKAEVHAVDEMMRTITANRRSRRKAPRL